MNARIINQTSIMDDMNKSMFKDDSVITPIAVMSASPTNLPNVPASVARNPEFHVPLSKYRVHEAITGGNSRVMWRGRFWLHHNTRLSGLAGFERDKRTANPKR